MAIDHYLKWCEAKAIVDHNVEIVVRFLEDELIYRFNVSKYILTNNGFKWLVEFDQLCKNYGITHQNTMHKGL